VRSLEWYGFRAQMLNAQRMYGLGLFLPTMFMWA
jgi:hypothetical protein